VADSEDLKKERGWGLTILIPLGILGSALSFSVLLLSLLVLDENLAELTTPDVVLLLIQSFLVIVFLIAAWRWQKWGCFGLILIMLLSAVFNLVNGGQPALLLASGGAIAFLYLVYRSKKQYFE
jgi:hypothetical protein